MRIGGRYGNESSGAIEMMGVVGMTGGWCLSENKRWVGVKIPRLRYACLGMTEEGGLTEGALGMMEEGGLTEGALGMMEVVGWGRKIV